MTGATTVVISDACCLLNLYAAGDLASLLRGIGWEVHASAGVVAEAYFTLVKDPDDPSELVPAPIDLAPALGAGLLKLCQVTGAEEVELFVRLASALDDGEASCLAVAKIRGWALATDDRKARRMAGELGVPTISTAELMKRWADRTGIGADEVATALRNIQTYANYLPRPGSPLYSWWIAQTDPESPST